MSKLDTLQLSTKEVIYVVSACAAFIFNWYSLKLEIRELAITKASQDKITELRISELSKQITDLRRDCDRLLEALPQAYAIKPKEINFEPENRNQ